MINKVILLGNVGQDPEVRTLETGVKVARLRLATTERIFNRQTNENTEHTEWHSITLWRGLAEVADKYIRKGSQIYIEGRIRTRAWDDQTGNKRYTTEIMADNLQLLGKKTDNPGQGGYQPQGGYQQPQPSFQQPGVQPQSYAPVQQPAPQQPQTQDLPEDDLPF